MNSGPIGSLTSSLIIRSISAFASASSAKSKTSETGSTWSGRRAPQRAATTPG